MSSRFIFWPLFEQQQHAVVGFGRAEAVDAGLTDETMMASRRSKSERVAERRSLSSSSLMVASFSMKRSPEGM